MNWPLELLGLVCRVHKAAAVACHPARELRVSEPLGNNTCVWYLLAFKGFSIWVFKFVFLFSCTFSWKLINVFSVYSYRTLELHLCLKHIRGFFNPSFAAELRRFLSFLRIRHRKVLVYLQSPAEMYILLIFFAFNVNQHLLLWISASIALFFLDLWGIEYNNFWATQWTFVDFILFFVSWWLSKNCWCNKVVLGLCVLSLLVVHDCDLLSCFVVLVECIELLNCFSLNIIFILNTSRIEPL
jgi:hypothetical protein